MTHSEPIGSTALVTGASRGFGRAIAAALHTAGTRVLAVASNADLLASLRDELGGTSGGGCSPSTRSVRNISLPSTPTERRAVGVYRALAPGEAPKAFSIQVLDVISGRISAIHAFLDPRLFERFNLPGEIAV